VYVTELPIDWNILMTTLFLTNLYIGLYICIYRDTYIYMPARKIPIRMRNKPKTEKGMVATIGKDFVIENAKVSGGKLSVYECRLTKRIPMSTAEKFIGGHYKISQYYTAGWLHILQYRCVYQAPRQHHSQIRRYSGSSITL
jgi:hypothetical protein